MSNFVSSYACMACNLKKRDNVLSPTIGGWTVNCFIATAFCYGFVCFACMCACAFIQTRKRNTACSIASMYIYSVIRVSVLFICLLIVWHQERFQYNIVCELLTDCSHSFAVCICVCCTMNVHTNTHIRTKRKSVRKKRHAL